LEVKLDNFPTREGIIQELLVCIFSLLALVSSVDCLVLQLTKVPWFTFAITLFGIIGGWLTTMYTVANVFYSPAHDRWDAWCTRRTGSGRVGTAADTDDSTNGRDQSNAGSDAPLRESTTSRHDLNIVAGHSHSTKTLELSPVETVVEQTIQPGDTTSSGNPVMRQRSIARSVSEKEFTGLPQL
jgi:hypothetical protein